MHREVSSTKKISRVDNKPSKTFLGMQNHSIVSIVASHQSGRSSGETLSANVGGVRGTIRRSAPNNNNGGGESPPEHHRYEPSAHYRRLNDFMRFPSSAAVSGVGGSLAEEQMLRSSTVDSSSPSIASMDVRSTSGSGIGNTYRASPHRYVPTSSSSLMANVVSSEDSSSLSLDADSDNLMVLAPYGSFPQSIANKRLLTEMKQLEELPLAGCQASPREDNIFQWTAVINGPENTVYEGGTFFVDMIFNERYPFVAPKVFFLTRIYHCNINSQGKVCMDPISNSWNSCMTISTVLQSLISLMYACNPRDALVPSIAEQFLKYPDEYDKMARIWTQRYAQ